MTEKKVSSISIIKEFLADDPNPPDNSEIMAFMRDTNKEERDAMAASILADQK